MIEPVKAKKIKKQNTDPPALDFSAFDDPDAAAETWKEWTQVKKEQFRFTYKGNGEQKAITSLANKAQNRADIAALIVENSIINGYKGLFELSESDIKKHAAKQPNNSTGLVFDIDLNGSTDHYKKYWERTKEAFPNVAQEIRFFTASEFKKFIAPTPEWFPMIHQCISDDLYKKHIKTALAQLESDSNRKRTAQGGLYSYLTGFITQKAKE